MCKDSNVKMLLFTNYYWLVRKTVSFQTGLKTSRINDMITTPIFTLFYKYKEKYIQCLKHHHLKLSSQIYEQSQMHLILINP